MSNYFHGKLYKTSNRPIAGGTGDIWRFEDGQKRIYAVKVYRVSNGEEYKIKVCPYPVKFRQSTHFPCRNTSKR